MLSRKFISDFEGQKTGVCVHICSYWACLPSAFLGPDFSFLGFGFLSNPILEIFNFKSKFG